MFNSDNALTKLLSHHDACMHLQLTKHSWAARIILATGQYLNFQEWPLRTPNPLLLDDIGFYEPADCAGGYVVGKWKPGFHDVNGCQCRSVVEILDEEGAYWNKACSQARQF